jgi:SAM-dependent methyltransferase
VSTWHHGVIARWWAEFNHGGPEVEYFRPFVASGQPALDAGCGAGRLLLPYLREGFDVDGCDVSADMLGECRRLAAAEGLEPTLYAQALHRLDLPRRYRTIVACGVFGLGSTREEDEEALRRLHDHLQAGGLLAFDAGARWEYEDAAPQPERDEPPEERRRGADGAEYALRSRIVDVNQETRRVRLALHAWMSRDDDLVADEEHELTEQFYDRAELVGLLERAGFVDVDVHSADSAWGDDMLVYLARRPVV